MQTQPTRPSCSACASCFANNARSLQHHCCGHPCISPEKVDRSECRSYSNPVAMAHQSTSIEKQQEQITAIQTQVETNRRHTHTHRHTYTHKCTHRQTPFLDTHLCTLLRRTLDRMQPLQTQRHRHRSIYIASQKHTKPRSQKHVQTHIHTIIKR